MKREFPRRVESLEARIAPAFAAWIDAGALEGAIGFSIQGANNADNLGYSVSTAGDVNGDGFADLFIGAYGADLNGGESAGAAYVIFGKAGGFTSPFSLASLNGSNGFRLEGLAAADYTGQSVADAGDINGDGFDDLIIGASGADPRGDNDRGATYVILGKRSGFNALVDLATLDGADGFKIIGEAAGDYSGTSVSGAGDVNGDGFADLLISAPSASANGVQYCGAIYVVFGKKHSFPATLNLAALSGNNGFKIIGEATEDYAGTAVAAAGDVNGDGFDDFLIGAYNVDRGDEFDSGAAYVVFGRSSFTPLLELSALNGRNGFKVTGESAQDYAGIAVSGAGDVNGDGVDDIVIGAAYADPAGDSAGVAYVVFGKRDGFASAVDLSAVNGANGFRIEGTEAGDFVGKSVSGAGDVNGDGIDDLIVGAPGAGTTENGASYVVFGHTGQFAASVPVSGLDGIVGFEIRGAASHDSLGGSVSGAGDINNDGFADLLIGAPVAGVSTFASGAAYVLFGRSSVPNIHIDNASVIEGDSGTATLQFVVTLDGPSAEPVTVNFAFEGVSASAGTDYLAPLASGLTFAPGEVSKTITADVIGESNVEPHETLLVRLLTATNARIIGDVGTGTILNDDAVVRILDASAPEGGTGTTPLPFTITLDQPSVRAVTVNVATLNGGAIAGSDYTALPPTLVTFAPGETTRSIAIGIIGDTETESDEHFTVALSDAVNAIIGDGEARATIVNDENLLRIDSGSVVEGDAGARELAFTVTLDTAHDDLVTVDYEIVAGTAAQGSDYLATPSGTLSFIPGQTAQTIRVLINGDAIPEADETFAVVLSGSVNAAIEEAWGDGTIVNDDGALRIADAAIVEGYAGPKQMRFAVSLDFASALPVIVDFTVVDGTALSGIDYTAVSGGTLSFAPGETIQFVSVEVAGDSIVEESETFAVILSSPTNAIVEDGNAVGTILNDDTSIVVSPDGKNVTVMDTDGDLIKIGTSKGALSAANFVFGPDGSIQTIDLLRDETFRGANLTITAEKGGSGDGLVDVGVIDATDLDLGNLIVSGTLGRIIVGDGDPTKPALKSLTVGGLGTDAPVDDPLLSEFRGSLNKLNITGDVRGAAVDVSGKLGKVNVGGDLVGDTGNGTALLASLLRGDGIVAAAGTGGIPVGAFTAGSIGGFTVSGEMHGGSVASASNIARVNVGSDFNGAAIAAAGQISSVKVVGDLKSEDPAAPAVVAALGQVASNNAAGSIAIAKFQVRGNMENAQILLGYAKEQTNGLPQYEAKNPDAGSGKIVIQGNWSATSLVAGVFDATDDGFGRNDQPIGGDTTPRTIAKIASIVIKGTVTGSALEGDHFGIVAQQIGKLRIGGENIALSDDVKDNVLLDETNGDFRLLEV